jgi:hypothetical protein
MELRKAYASDVECGDIVTPIDGSRPGRRVKAIEAVRDVLTFNYDDAGDSERYGERMSFS